MLSPMNLTIDLRSAAVPHGLDLPVARSRQVCIYWLWKHCLFCRDCLWGGKEIYMLLMLALLCWRRPVGDALHAPLATPCSQAQADHVCRIATETRPIRNTLDQRKHRNYVASACSRCQM